MVSLFSLSGHHERDEGNKHLYRPGHSRKVQNPRLCRQAKGNDAGSGEGALARGWQPGEDALQDREVWRGLQTEELGERVRLNLDRRAADEYAITFGYRCNLQVI